MDSNEQEVGFVLPAMNYVLMKIRVVGVSMLVQNNISEEALKAMEKKQTKQAEGTRQAKNPKKCFQAALYPHPDGGYGHPGVAFYKSAIRAAKHLPGLNMKDSAGILFVIENMVKIDGTPVMRRDLVRLAKGGADLRYRPQWDKWSAEFTVRYDESMLSAEQVLNLFATAGMRVGIGEGRPERGEKSMGWGTFELEKREG